jgi:hypothetical protein
VLYLCAPHRTDCSRPESAMRSMMVTSFSAKLMAF